MLAVQMAPLQLEGYYIKELQYAVKQGLDEEIPFAMQPGLHLQRIELFNPSDFTINIDAISAVNKDEPLRWRCMLTLSSADESNIRYPYQFRTVIVGYFKVSDTYPDDKAETMVKITGTSILYSAAREQLATVTGRGPFPAIVLPTVTFLLPNAEDEPVAQGKKAATKKSLPRATKKGASKKATK